jgi:hypothetical protein
MDRTESSTIVRRVRTALFDLDPNGATMEVRGFTAATSDKRSPLEEAGASFVTGYRAAIHTADPRETAVVCSSAAPLLQGFAFEGAGMGLAILDLVSGGVPRRFRAFVEEYAVRHAYPAHVGAGWAIARCPWGALTFLPALDPFVRWLTVEGIGFHAAFYHPSVMLGGGRRSLLRRWGADAYDDGVGRALWFAAGVEPTRVRRSIEAFASPRWPALWSGVGLAASYAGGTTDEDLHELKRAASVNATRLAVGAAFAAKTRAFAGNPADHTDRACRVFCGRSAVDAAAIADACVAEAHGARDPFRRCIELLASCFDAAAAGCL